MRVRVRYARMKASYPPVDYLKRRMTFDEAEAESHKLAAELGVSISDHWLRRWVTFKAQFVEGDELWLWEYFPGPMTGGAGYCIVRNGLSVAWIATTRA
jgi:hypothetical protein